MRTWALRSFHPTAYLPIQMPWSLPKPQQIRSYTLNALKNTPDATELETPKRKSFASQENWQNPTWWELLEVLELWLQHTMEATSTYDSKKTNTLWCLACSRKVTTWNRSQMKSVASSSVCSDHWKADVRSVNSWLGPTFPYNCILNQVIIN